jgi:predicted O-methyltransferase YrrM
MQILWRAVRFIGCLAKLIFYRRLRVGMPMMAIDEILILRAIINLTRPIRCLEWGTGFSTTYFFRFLGPEARWNSIEHDRSWHAKIRSKLKQQKKVHLSLVEPEHLPWTDRHSDGALSDLKSYVNYPQDRLGGFFDFILIDGRARRDCLDLSYDLASENGVVILHDANRPYYFEGVTRTFPYEYKFLDGREGGGLFIGARKSLDPAISCYQKMWKYTCRFRKWKNEILKKIRLK